MNSDGKARSLGMKIDLSQIDREQFTVKEGIIAGEICYLVNPNHIGCKWTADNLIFRSSIWNSNGEPVSFSFKKFFNWEEHTEITPKPDSLSDCKLPSKIDGSTLIISYYKGELIARTRGCFNAQKLENGFELEVLKKKYPFTFNYHKGFSDDYSLLFEWISPLNRIVLSYGPEPDLYLIGCIKHEDYSLLSQTGLDMLAEVYGLKRPKSYSFNSFDEMIKGIEGLKGEEGICVYYNNGQDIRKVKSIEYLAKHRFKSNATLENIIDLFFSLNCPDSESFKQQIIKTFDFECYQMVEQFIPIITDGYKQVNKQIHDIRNFIQTLFIPERSRKECAMAIIGKYPDSYLKTISFLILDRKELTIDNKKNMLDIIIKNDQVN